MCWHPPPAPATQEHVPVIVWRSVAIVNLTLWAASFFFIERWHLDLTTISVSPYHTATTKSLKKFVSLNLLGSPYS